MKGETLRLTRDWQVGDQIGGGGFATVWEATSGDETAAVKFIPKDPGAEREVLFVDVDARNVVPVIDRGEHGDFWVIVMPRAERSLRQLINAHAGPLPAEIALEVLRNVATALEDLDGQVVHRDLKPENVLELHGTWQIADFGISRYAEATTAAETKKFSFTPPYAAPEQWRLEHATAATDIYAFGVMAYEMLAGARPFPGPRTEDFHEQHLHQVPEPIPGLTAGLDALVTECLYKPPVTRPRAANVVARLSAAADRAAESSGLAMLGDVNRQEARRYSQAAAQASVQQSAAERRSQIHATAVSSWERVTNELRATIEREASSADITNYGGGFVCVLGQAKLTVSGARPASAGGQGLALSVTSAAEIDLVSSHPAASYAGRSHSFWFCDAQGKDDFAWFETAFMTHPLMGHRREQEPFALDPGPDAARALGPGMADIQVAWPFTRVDLGDLHQLIDRWAGWLASCARGSLSHPTSMPERNPAGSWRQS
jgi:hypothetical protein